MAKILIFSNAYYPTINQASKAIKKITDALPDNEYYLITNRTEITLAKEEKIGNINVHRIGYAKKKDKWLYPFRAIGYAVRLHNHVKFDFAWCRPAFYSGFVALFFKYKTKVPYLLTLEFADFDKDINNKVWYWSYFYKNIFKSAKFTQSISRYLAKNSRGFGNKQEIFLVPDGIDLEIYKNTLLDSEKNKIREDLGITQEELFLVSRSAVLKTYEDLVKALNWLSYKIGIESKLLILSAQAEEEKIMRLAEMTGVGDRVIFLQDVSDIEIVKYIESADIFVRPDTVPSLGTSFLQAMAVGTPIVATDVGGTVDFLKDGQTGILCEKNKPSSIAQAIEKIFKDKELYKSISGKGQNFVREKYSWNQVIEKMKLVFEKML